MSDPNDGAGLPERLVKRHLRIGWWLILGFLTLGIGLEWLHATKVPWYINEAFGSRRLLWTLAHAHGVLLGLLNVAFAATLDSVRGASEKSMQIASNTLLFASVLMPAGFWLGGAVLDAGDPGLAVWLLPIGGVLLAIAAVLTARIARGRC